MSDITLVIWCFDGHQQEYSPVAVSKFVLLIIYSQVDGSCLAVAKKDKKK